MKPVFLIYCPTAFTTISGGVIALHKLAHNLALLGETAFIMTGAKNPAYLGQQINMDTAKVICANDKAIVIYPEVVKGNPLGAKYIMRWLLNTPGVIPYCDDAKDYAQGHEYDCNMLYKFAPIYKSPDEKKVKGELRAIENWLDIFTDTGKQRKGDCAIYRKGAYKQRDKKYGDINALVIDSYINQLNPQQYVADIFNRHERFVSYDDACYLSVQAALCGCLSIVVPKEGVSAKEWHEKMPYFKYGIAYGIEEIEFAKETMPLVRGHIKSLEDETLLQAQVFIKDSYSLFA